MSDAEGRPGTRRPQQHPFAGPSPGPPLPATPRDHLPRRLLAQDAEQRGEKRSQWTDSILDRSPTTRPAPTLGGSEALHIGSDVASALSAAHGQRVLHRGLMPRRERHRFFSLESLSLGKPGKRAQGGQSRASTCTALPVSTRAGKAQGLSVPQLGTMGPSSALASMSSVRTPPRIQHLPHM